MKNHPNKATVKEGLPTAERTTTPWKKEMLPSFGCDIWSGERCICTMDDYPDAEKDADLIVESVNNYAELRERVKELEAKLSEIADIDQEDDTAWDRMKEIRADDYDLKTEREEGIFQFAFFEGIRYIQKALKK